MPRTPLHRRLRIRLAAQEGMALVLALGVSLVLGATVATTVAYSTQNATAAGHAKDDQLALALAEAGLNNALAALFSATSPSMPNAVPEQSEAYEGGTATWYGTLEDEIWTLVGVGRARGAVRTVTTRAKLGSSTKGSSNNAVWNYVYADSVATCTTIGNKSEVNVPFYVRGDLCMSNQATVTGYALQVGGTLKLTNEARVGSPGAPVTEAHIGVGCTRNNGPLSSPCTAADYVWAERVTSAPTALTKPPVDFAYWYEHAKPGPQHPCTIGSVPGGFDDDGVWNRSRAAFNLTPSTAYDCRVLDGEGKLVGQLSWAPGAPGTLTIAGTIFFDGDVSMGQYSTAVYEGRATIYAAGRFTLAQQSFLCGVAACDESWKPEQNLLSIVAGAPTGNSVEISNFSHFQGAIYAVNDFREGNNSTVWGPIIADQIYLQNSTLNHYVPIGTLLPGMPATYEEAVTLTTEPGSFGS